MQPVGPAVSLDPVAFTDQPRQAIVRDRDMQIVRIIVANVFPVHGAGAVPDRAHRLHLGKAVLHYLVFKRRHHFADRGEPGGRKVDEHEAVPDL